MRIVELNNNEIWCKGNTLFPNTQSIAYFLQIILYVCSEIAWRSHALFSFFANYMGNYLRILEIRAEIEKIDLFADLSDEEENYEAWLYCINCR